MMWQVFAEDFWASWCRGAVGCCRVSEEMSLQSVSGEETKRFKVREGGKLGALLEPVWDVRDVCGRIAVRCAFETDVNVSPHGSVDPANHGLVCAGHVPECSSVTLIILYVLRFPVHIELVLLCCFIV